MGFLAYGVLGERNTRVNRPPSTPYASIRALQAIVGKSIRPYHRQVSAGGCACHPAAHDPNLSGEL